MTDKEYFSQRLNPREFERLWFFRCNPESPDTYYLMGEKGPLHSIFYDADSGIMNLHLHRDWSWDDMHTLLDRVHVFTPNELKFLLDRVGRFRKIGEEFKRPPCGGGVTIECNGGGMAYLPRCGSDHGFEKKKRRTGSGSASWPATIEQDEPWGEKLPLGGFYVSCPVPKEPVGGTASVSGRIWVRNQAPTCWDSQPTKTALWRQFKPVYPGVWPWIKRLFGIYTP